MTDSDDDRPWTENENTKSDRSSDDAGFELDRERILTALRWGALFAFVMLILIAGAGLYSSLGSIIDVWVADRYQPIARAGLNFALLCAAIGGVVWTLRRP